MGLMETILPGAPWAGQDIVNRKVWNSLSFSLSLYNLNQQWWGKTC